MVSNISKKTTLIESNLNRKNFTLLEGIIKDADEDSFHIIFTRLNKKFIFYNKNSAIYSPKVNEKATCYFPEHPYDSFPTAVIQSKLIIYIEKEKYKEIKKIKEEIPCRQIDLF
ncbi:MAG: hypothetical protein PF542_00040 [Nanoarchaeota archaeon]|jgi:hypothetical protein|nr:hypothetical protein [Nanoarchaeota archaeon]